MMSFLRYYLIGCACVYPAMIVVHVVRGLRSGRPVLDWLVRSVVLWTVFWMLLCPVWVLLAVRHLFTARESNIPDTLSENTSSGEGVGHQRTQDGEDDQKPEK